MSAISLCGVLDVRVRTGTTDGEVFYNFINKNLLPHLQPFNGINQHSVVVMDNCSIHHIPDRGGGCHDTFFATILS